MDKNLTYQQARRIRGTGLGKIFADQLEQNATVGQAFKRTISLKMQSKVKGIQEKFDPLNIAKFMTFGSSWAPALLGKLTGRSHDDTRYFSGRLKPIVVKQSGKITPLPKDGEELVEGKNIRVKGMNDQLFKIYKFLKKSQDADKKRRELEHNFDEERADEAERRHKEFMKVLSAITGGGTTTIVEVGKKTTIFDQLKDWLTSPVLSWAARFISLDAFATSLLALGPMALLAAAVYEAQNADINNPGSNIFANTGASGLAFAKWVDEKTGRSQKLKAEQEARNEERMTKGDPWEKKSANTDAEQLKSLASIIQNYEKIYTESKGEDKKQVEVALTQLYDQRDALIKKIGGVDAPGERIAPLKKTASAVKPEAQKAATAQVVSKSPTPASGTGGGLTPVASASTSSGAASTPTTGQSVTASPEATPSASTPLTAKQVSSPSTQTQQLNVAMAENAEANLPKQKADESIILNNIKSSVRKKSNDIDSLSELAVRNEEPTLMDMIVKQTRLT